MVPKLRFKEFCGEWDLKLLKDITEKIGDGLHGTPKYDENGEYFFINGNNIRNGKIIVLEENKKVGEDEFIKNDKGLDFDTVLMSINGTIGNLAYYNNEKVFLGKSVAYIKVSDEIKKQYLFQVLQTNFIQKYYTLSLTGTTIKNLGLDAIRNTKIKLPSLPEQTKIADFLSTVDDKIQNQQDKITHLENIKKGFMQKIFSRKIRFKDDEGEEFPEWEEKKLGDIADIYDGTHQTPNYVSSGIPFVSVENIKDLYKTEKYIELDAFKREFKIYPQKNDILMTRIGDIGTPCIVEKNDKIAYYVSLALIKIHKNNKVISNFLLQYIKNSKFQSELWKRTLHIAFPKKINKCEISKCLIYLPCIKEQQKIADFLSSFDEKISIEKETLEHLKQLKKGLLQQMFV